MWVILYNYKYGIWAIAGSYLVPQCSPFFKFVHKLDRKYCFNPTSSHPEVYLVKGILKIYSKFTGEHPCRSLISTKLLWNFIEITLWHGCSPINLLHVFRTPFTRNAFGWLKNLADQLKKSWTCSQAEKFV